MQSKDELPADLCPGKLGVPLEQIVAEEQAKWRAAKEAEEAARAAELARQEYLRRVEAMRRRASSRCLEEARALVLKG